MGKYKYITNRTLLNDQGKEVGKVKAVVLSGSETLEGEYTCPECGHSGKVNQLFIRPISVRCDKCKYLMKMQKLKGKVKS